MDKSRTTQTKTLDRAEQVNMRKGGVVKDYATYNRRAIEAARKRGQHWNRLSQEAKRNNRLAAAIEHGPVRPLHSVLCGELAWHNCFTGQRTLLELWKEPDGSTFRFTVYVDGERWRNGWSRFGFAQWLMEKIDRLRVDWDA